MRLAATLSAVLILIAPAGAQQSSAPAGTFQLDVASVRPVQLATSGAIQDILPTPPRVLPGDRFETAHGWLGALIAFAYGFDGQYDRLKGAEAERYQTFAVVARGTPGSFEATSPDHLQPVRHMVQQLLAERFNLQAHVEQEQRPVLLLKRVSQNSPPGPKLHPLPNGCVTFSAFAEVSPPPPDVPRCKWFPDGPTLTATGTFAEFTRNMSASMRREVVDETGLSGTYLFSIKFNPETFLNLPPDLPRPFPPPDYSDEPAFKTVLKSDLGLVLEEAMRPISVLVIDHLEPLREN